MSTRISTSQMFQTSISGYQKGYAEIVKTQQQISSGVRIQTPADDPVGAARLLQLEQQQAQLEQYSANMTTATNSLTQQVALLDTVINVLQNARELAVRAGNGALSDEDRSSIASELDQIMEQLLDLMNSQDASGNYIFAGSKSGVQPFVRNPDGSVSYQGDQTSLNLQVSGSGTLAINDSGWSIFENVPNASRTQSNLDNDPNTDGQRVYLSQGQVGNTTQYDKTFRAGEPYTLELVSSTQFRILDNLGNDVTSEASSNSGVFDPTAIDGTTINFRGASFELDVALQEADGQGDLDSLLTGYSFTFGVADTEIVTTRSASNTSTAQLTSGSVVDPTAYTTQFPSSGVQLRFTSASDYEVYAQPVLTGSTPIASGSLSGTYPETIGFAGVELQISAAPAAGDTFVVQGKSAETQSVFETIGNLSAALKTPVSGDPAAQLALTEAVASAISNLDNGMNQVLATQASIGARLNVIDTLSTENESLQIANASSQSTIRDTDMAEAISKLVLQMTKMEAAQASFVRISQLSLFNKM
ncbi:flagellar hook-associated protein 3 [Pseudomonas sediminis]|uniref:flagellar hook-associated protein 3 n=1 Tax=Pseudomonas sediminis TaxID=1691904 RepID=UPI00244A8D88|nr:flagellar hook-associated protein 3 [Pseudomonas sediminis]MDG9757389.1 flagellar hook-associated protein 3 [Pseudomonas sediminis]